MKAIPREAQIIATNSTAIRELRLSLSLNALQKQVLVGTLLGDGCLVANSWKKNYRFKAQQCDKQKSYLFWKYDIFKEFTLSPPQYQKLTKSWGFRTMSHPELTAYRKIFYPQGQKIVPKEIEILLTHPLSLAIWYMDDGALSTRKDAFILNTQSFSYDDNIKLQECIKKNFQVKCTLNRDKVYWRLYIHKESAKHFLELIQKYVTALMNEKLPVAP